MPRTNSPRACWRTLGLCAFSAFTLWLVLYLPRLPVAVQGGDTAEIATAGTLLMVAHPPGYPLLILLLHWATSLFDGVSPFWDVALVSSLFSLATLTVVALAGRRTPRVTALLVASLATSRVFWKFSELPDVFSLHWFLLAVACWIYIEKSIVSESRRTWLLSIVFGLSFANHLTTVFMAPLWLMQIKKDRAARSIVGAALAGMIITAAVYCSLFLFNTASTASWGSIESLEDLFRHFLRKDYGTFQLTAGAPHVNFWMLSWYAIKSSASDFCVPVLLGWTILVTNKWKQKNLGARVVASADFKTRALFFCFIFYCVVFFSLSNIDLADVGRETFDRFTVMPQILIIFAILAFAAAFEDQVGIPAFLKPILTKRVFVIAAIGLTLIIGISRNGKLTDYSQRTIIEDLVKNYLSQPVPDPTKKTLVTAISDSTVFSTYYVLEILKFRPDFIPFNVGTIHKRWYQQHLKKLIPDIQISALDKPEQNESEYTYKNFVSENFERFNILYERDGVEPDWHLRFGRIGRFISKGKGRSFLDEKDLALQLRSEWHRHYVADYREFDLELAIYSYYAHHYLARGMDYFNNSKFSEAIEMFDRGLEIVPYCQPCLANKCLVLSLVRGSEHKECFNLLTKLRANFTNYYSGMPFTGVSVGVSK